MTSLPSSFSFLSLFPASKEQILESRTRSFASWGRGTSLDQYLARDSRSDNHEVSLNNRLVTWVLARRDSPDSLDFMCSCETYRRDGLVARKSKSGNSVPEDVNCYAIASVFTPAANRGKGYARHMMRLLHWLIAPREYLPKEFPIEWGSPPVRPSYISDGAFSVLYSDVGENFYRLCGPAPDKDGWLVTSPITTTWDVVKSHELLSTAEREEKLAWKWLDESLVNEVWKADAALMKEEMSQISPSHTVECTFLPTKGVADFQHHRLQQFWGKMSPKPIHWGVYSNSTSRSEGSLDASTFASWTLDVRPSEMNKMIITRLRVQPKDFEELLFKVIDFAKQHSVEIVEVWNLDPNTFSRDEHLPSFKWYGEGGPQHVAWIYNERYG
ncbi:hypothetical protein BDZ97DRAFT_1901166 [Flammula alnicola]|nr:hypothetical protein BDZ97DRAFT_1901166 [Flammula alnicola]